MFFKKNLKRGTQQQKEAFLLAAQGVLVVLFRVLVKQQDSEQANMVKFSR